VPEEKTEKNLISLSRASEITGYNQDYLGFLARSGKLEAQKIGRNWVTSVAAINSLLGNAPDLVQQVVKPDGFVQSDLFAIKQAAQKVFDDQREESIKLSVASKLQKFEEDFKLEMSAAVAAATAEKVFGIVPQLCRQQCRQQKRRHLLHLSETLRSRMHRVQLRSCQPLSLSLLRHWLRCRLQHR
jgi:hypothetical protein